MEALETDGLREAGVAGRAEARRLEALTEGEFRDVVRALRASDAPEAKAFAEKLEAAQDELVATGDVVPDSGPRPSVESRFEDLPAPPPGQGFLDRLRAERPEPTLDDVDEFYRRRAASTRPPPTADAAQTQTAAAFATLGIPVRIGPARLGETMRTVFGPDRIPSLEEWKNLIPLHALEQIAEVGRVRVDVLGDSFIWSAEGVPSVTAPHRSWSGFDEAGGVEEEAWRISRTFFRNDAGQLEVHHDHFFVRGDLQNTGGGAQVLRTMMNAYRRVGVDVVTVDAIEVGKYFWPSIGFDCPAPALERAKASFQRWAVQNEKMSGDEAAAAVAKVRSLPSLAQLEYGKDFLLDVSGPWNSDLRLELKDENPLFHLMRGRLDVAAAAVLGVGGMLEGAERVDQGERDLAAGAAASPFAAAAATLRGGRARLVRDVAKRLFSAAAEPTARVTARLAYSRAQLDARRAEIAEWTETPQALVDRVAEGLRDVPGEAFHAASAGVFTAAAFLREKLPQTHQPSPVALGRGVPVSAEAAAKYARYEQAALRPGEAWREAAESGYISPELLETTQELYPDLLAEVRVEAYQAIRAGGPPRTIQAKTQYARLFDGDGTLADAAFSPTAARMVNYAYDQQAAVVPPTPSSARVSQSSVAVAAPRPWAPAPAG